MFLDITASDYDNFGQIYNDSWGLPYCQKILPILEELLLQHLSPRAHILDLGCGTGQVVQQLLIKGYQVTGLDASEGMLRYARQNAPDGQFILGDARLLKLPTTFDAVVSTNAVLNHFLNLEELTGIFHNVYETLKEEGLFVFDMDMEEYYQSQRWQGAVVQGDIRDEYAWAFRGNYSPENKIGQYQMTLFQLVEKTWRRSDSSWKVKAYTREEIQLALKSAGFVEISIGKTNSKLETPLNAGTIFFVARKSSKK
ncbi:MAG: class I SAM-dependent methyltransferase [Coleofasciculus sp. B1-GNL1-01]|uniref:class I SAM-dependent methyltransferase n=1 Tax=Coleofasciculus sp. B1-GNL1-01 TaxID=3068484 RepID=UPI0032FFF114